MDEGKVFAELKVESCSETPGERMDSVFDAWVRGVRLEHQAHPATGRSYASAARRFCAAFGHHRPVRGIPDADIERFRTARLEAGISPTTVNHDLVRLATALRWAQRAGRYHGPLPTVRKIKVARRKIPKHSRARTSRA